MVPCLDKRHVNPDLLPPFSRRVTLDQSRAPLSPGPLLVSSSHSHLPEMHNCGKYVKKGMKTSRRRDVARNFTLTEFLGDIS